MSTESVTPDLTGPGVLLGADSGPSLRHGERAALIRKMALRYPELSNTDIGKRVGCTGQNVGQVLSAFLSGKHENELVEFRENKAELFEALQYRTLASVTEADISKAPFMARITAAAIMEDKIRLMRGQPTSIHVHALVDVLDALRMRDDDK